MGMTTLMSTLRTVFTQSQPEQLIYRDFLFEIRTSPPKNFRIRHVSIVLTTIATVSKLVCDAFEVMMQEGIIYRLNSLRVFLTFVLQYFSPIGPQYSSPVPHQ